VVEELDGYIEKEIKALAKDVNPNLKVYGKDLLPEIGELDSVKVISALSKITGKKFTLTKEVRSDLPKRTARLCEGCPYWNVFPILKKIAPEAIFAGDIGCNMIAGLAPHNIQDTLFCMGASIGIGHGIKKSTDQKVIAVMGDGTFFHSGIAGLINAVYNKSNPLMIVLDNRITAMTGHQTNPGMGKTLMGEDTQELSIEEIVKSCGVKNVKVLDPANMQEFENTVKEFLDKDEISLIVCKKICALLAKRQKNG
jgi:indolepyruvate ferredoxin oxidoreductase alpha subunit